MTDWSQLRHAYGSAEDIPGLLDRIEADHDGRAWSDLWSALCHQGDVYSASFAALPRLAAIASGRGAREGDAAEAVVLAASIMAGEDQPHGAGDVRKLYGTHIETMRRIAGRMLRVERDTATYIYLLQSVLAFEGDPTWGDRLDGLVNEEYEVECPGCTTTLFIAIGERGYFSCADDYAVRKDHRSLPLDPADPVTLHGLGERLYGTARADGRHEVAEKLTYLFGTATCTERECGASFSIADQVTACA